MAEDTTRAKRRVLDTAERLFYERGYKTVTMRHIADDLEIRQASLYYHAPGGKEDLYAQVLERSLARHREGLEAAIAGAKEDVVSQLRAAANWLGSQPPLHLTRILTSDLTNLEAKDRKRLAQLAHDSALQPIVDIFKGAQKRKEIRKKYDAVRTARSFVALTDVVWYENETGDGKPTKEKMSKDMIEMLLDGLRG